MITLILGVGLIFRLALSFFGTLQLDHGTFIAWANSLASEGFGSFYNGWSDYFPGYLYVLWLLGKINSLGSVPETLLFKFPAILADLATGLTIYKIILKFKSKKLALIGAALYIFNPAIFANSALWGQVDSFTALTTLLSVYLLPTNYFLSAVFLAIGTLIKPQAAFILPVIIYLFLKHKKSFWEFLNYSLTGLVIFALAFVPFWNRSTLPSFIFERISLSLNQYPYTSVNAFNFWALGGMWKPDNWYFQIFGYVLVFITAGYLCFKLWKVKHAQYYLLAFIFSTSFVFFTRMHERHLLPVFAPLVIVAIKNPIFMIPYIGFSITYLANLYFSYIYVVDNFRNPFSDFVVKFLEVLNIGLVATIFYTILKRVNTQWDKALSLWNNFKKENYKIKTTQEYELPKTHVSQGKLKKYLYLVLAFAFFTRVFNLSSPETMYFDEVYHAFTAKVLLGSEAAKAWEWWNTPPEGFAYEWTHPPFAKLGMALGMIIFGENSFGWRIPGAILGTGCVYLVYLLAREIFKDELIGLLASGAYSLEGLALVMSRIGMNDSYILFFVLLSLYLYIKDKNFLSALSFGFALASKWSSVWAIPIFGVIFLYRKKKINLTYLWFFTLPIVIYLLSYFDLFATGHTFKTWWEMQQQMWWYHTGLRATHSYSSAWWSWPMLLRPIYLYTSSEVGGAVSRIYAFGNPLVFWFGITSIVTCLVFALHERSKKLMLVVFSYLIFFVPWALSPRIMFIYHYLPSIPFMAISVGYILRRYPKIIPYFFVSAFILFTYFYPHYIGLKVPLGLDTSYYWFSSWR